MHPVGRDVDDGISGRAVGHEQGAGHHAGQIAAGLVAAPLMVVAVDVAYHRVGREHAGVVVVIVEVGQYGVVVDRQHARRAACGQGGGEPVQVFLLHMSVAHLHVRAAGDAGDKQRVGLDGKAVGAPQVKKCLGGALAPGRLMVAGKHGERVSYAVEDVLYASQLGVGAFVGEVAVHYHQVVVGGIDFVDSAAQHGVGAVAGRDVHIAKQRDAVCVGGRACGGSHDKYQKKTFHGTIRVYVYGKGTKISDIPPYRPRVPVSRRGSRSDCAAGPAGCGGLPRRSQMRCG